MKVISLTLAMIALACSSTTGDKPAKVQEPLKFRVIQQGEYGTLATLPPGTDDDPHPLVAHDHKTYLEQWENHIGPNQQPPEIDFKKETIVFLLNPQVKTGGYEIEVKGVSWDEDGRTLVVDAPVSEPKPDKITAQMFSAPYVIIAVNRPGLSVANWKRSDEPVAPPPSPAPPAPPATTT